MIADVAWNFFTWLGIQYILGLKEVVSLYICLLFDSLDTYFVDGM